MTGRIPDSFIDDLLARVDIVDVIEAHLPLRKAGRDFQALCPFHGEKSPSFTVSREKQFFHCFGCGAHGSAIGFLMKHRNLEFIEAVEELAQQVGLEIPREARRERVHAERDVYDLLDKARAHFERELRQSSERERAVDYLRRRGVSGECAKQFHIGLATSGWRQLLDALTAAGAREEELERAGLAIKRERGGYYDRFRDRIMFPIHDRRGRVIGFGGRVIDSGEPKYLNSPETAVFHKGRELYGLHEALHGSAKLARLLIVEGYLDVIALHQHGLREAVATLGTAVTREHLELAFRQVPEIVFCFDGDAAGRRAAWRALETSLPLLEGNRAVRFVFLPDGHDPDTAVREFGAEGFFAAARQYGAAEFLLDSLKSEVDLTNSDGRTRLVARAKPYLIQVPGTGHRASAVRLLAEMSRFDERLIRQELGWHERGQIAGVPALRLNRFTSRSLEEQALALLLHNPALAECVEEELADFLKREVADAELLLELTASIKAAFPASAAALIERWRDVEVGERLAGLAGGDLGIANEALESEFRDALKRLRAKGEELRVRRIKAIPFEQWTDEQRAIVRNYKRSQ
jgi:DNA primase